MESIILAGASLLGYLNYQKSTEKNFQQQNGNMLAYPDYQNCQNLPGYNQNYPSPNYYYPANNGYINTMPQQTQENFNTGPILGQGNYVTEPNYTSTMPQDNYAQNNYIPQDNPTNQYLMDINSRPVGDFSHANMVPFFGAKVTQNMAGTGVSQGSYTDGVTVDNGYDKSTPHQSTLALFTGSDDTYLHKREAGPMYSPAEQQTNWVFGSPGFREDADYYTRSMTIRNDMRPVESEMVGPGLNLDPNIPAAGGFHEYTRVMPNNVSDYKANQLEGRVKEGKFVSGAELPTSYPGIGLIGSNEPAPGVTKNRAPKDYSQARRPTMTTKAGFVDNAPMLYSDYQVDNRPKNGQRDQISYGYGNVVSKPSVENFENIPNAYNDKFNLQFKAGNGVGGNNGVCVDFPDTIGIAPHRAMINSQRSPLFMSQEHNINSKSDCNSFPIGNPAIPGHQGGPLLTNYYVNETDRGTVAPENVSQLNLKGQNLGTFYTYTDAPRTTMKETNEYSYSGDPGRQSQGSTFYTYIDDPKTTMKETNTYAYSGDPNNQSQGSTFYTYIDAPKTTMKETNEYSYSGDPNKQNGSKFYTWKDAPKSTIKQSTNFTYSGDPNKQSHGSTFYTYEDAPRSTIKQTTNYSYTGSADAGATKYVDTSRFQYTGRENFVDAGSKIKNALAGGADTYTIRDTTLVKDYFPGAGRQNIRQDASDIIGEYSAGTFGSDTNMNGPGTLAQAIPDGSKYQTNRFLAVPFAPTNKLIEPDTRQLASYTVDLLKKNPLSMWTNDTNGKIPVFLENTDPNTYSDIISSTLEKDEQFNVPKGDPGMAVNIYPPNNSVLEYSKENPNLNIVYNTQTENDYNPMIARSPMAVNNNPSFNGHGYSGLFSETGKNPNKVVETNSGPVTIFGPNHTYVPVEIGDIGMPNGPINGKVCKPNPALMFGGNTLILDKDFA